MIKFSIGPIAIIISLILISGFSYYGYNRYSLLETELRETKSSFLETSKSLNDVINNLQSHLASTTDQNRDLNDFLTILQARNSDFQSEIQEKQLKVATLEKLVETDPQLLQKYSKVYFLNENYIPEGLSLIENLFLFNKTVPVQIHSKVKPYLENLIRVARSENIDLNILSGYRSFETQKDVKAKHNFIYGSNSANRFSADQGYSEHQLGTTVDFTSAKTGSALTGFEKTDSYAWLLMNAHKFGFTLSYPPNNSYYIFEPWHWRFVGVSLATYLHAQNKYFHDLPQKDIEPYLVKIFD